ncbi:NAD(P)/FAD-dependent oxidoreductase [Leeuwenhoekiella sp. A16]|uniref:NAD(P)/FAD-dependent oxidoreductase n=1 Tax=unclassified Leeuwenhoekiella TaxID=2615029 RepID=UPI003A804255
MKRKEIFIIGGGLAGLSLAIHLSKAGIPTVVIEKDNYPRHKVCGEYVSNEVLPYLNYLDIDPFNNGAVAINELLFSGVSGASVQTNLPLGGFGISRYLLDKLLYDQALSSGARIIKDQVEKIDFINNEFTITTLNGNTFKSGIVIGAYGKRASLDISLKRKFITKKSGWLAVKSHYNGNYQENRVGLHNFKGGYCGLSNVEEKRINVCYLAHYSQFKKHKNIDDFREEVMRKNPHLNRFFDAHKPIFEKPLTISQISFDRKELISNHVLMCGDTASLIHPLCGNGMAMAIMGAKLLGETIVEFFDANHSSREMLEKDYKTKWQKNFSARLGAGYLLQNLLAHQKITDFAIKSLKNQPAILRRIIEATHGKAAHI